ARKYTNLDPEKEGDALQLVTLFVGQSASNIRKKLQRLEGEDSRNLNRLLEAAWK
ncbi:hypothetical protein FQV10_0006771, partial [Eudyptes schlegeli]